MSLVAFAIRVAAVRALRAALWPDVAVRDSPQAPLDLLQSGAPHPLVALYSSFESNKLRGRDLLEGEPRVTLNVQIFLPAKVALNVGGRPLTIDTGDAGADTVLDVMARRITLAFLDPGGLGTPGDAWSALLGSLAIAAHRVGAASYLVETERVRTAARELTFEFEVLAEPVPGGPAEGPFAELLGLMRADTGPDGTAPLADWIAAEIAGPAVLSQSDRDRIALGLSRYTARAIGLAADADPTQSPAGTPDEGIDVATAIAGGAA